MKKNRTLRCRFRRLRQVPSLGHQRVVHRVNNANIGAYLPSSLFILNMSIFSVLKIAFIAPSQMISRPFDGFCSLLDLIYAHNFFTTCGRDSESTSTSAARGSLS